MTLKCTTPEGGMPQAVQQTRSGAVKHGNLTTFRPMLSSTALDVAATWLSVGVPCIPIVKNGKTPATAWKRYTAELPTQDDLRRWWGRGQQRNLALVCGWAGLVVLDFDASESYRKWRLAHPGPSESYTVKTARGFHVYFWTDDARSFDLAGVEVRGAGRYVVAPPSVHPSGARYQAVNPRASILRVRLAAVLPSVEPSQKLPSLTPTSPGATIAQVLKSWDILQLAESLTSLKSSDGGKGRWWLGLCPFHDDHSPSFWLDTERRRFGCHAPQCKAHKSGDVINLFALAHGLDNATALAQMREGQR